MGTQIKKKIRALSFNLKDNLLIGGSLFKKDQKLKRGQFSRSIERNTIVTKLSITLCEHFCLHQINFEEFIQDN